MVTVCLKKIKLEVYTYLDKSNKIMKIKYNQARTTTLGRG